MLICCKIGCSYAEECCCCMRIADGPAMTRAVRASRRSTFCSDSPRGRFAVRSAHVPPSDGLAHRCYACYLHAGCACAIQSITQYLLYISDAWLSHVRRRSAVWVRACVRALCMALWRCGASVWTDSSTSCAPSRTRRAAENAHGMDAPRAGTARDSGSLRRARPGRQRPAAPLRLRFRSARLRRGYPAVRRTSNLYVSTGPVGA